MSASVAAGVMPRLEAFDQEFECEQPDDGKTASDRTGLRLSTLLLLALIAGVISVLALAWSNMSATGIDSTPGDVAAEQPEAIIGRLTREVNVLRREVRELAIAQRQAVETIASLQSQEESRGSSVTWYSDHAALTYGLASQAADAGLGIPSSRRSAVMRNRTRDAARREDGAPLSLEPPQ